MRFWRLRVWLIKKLAGGHPLVVNVKLGDWYTSTSTSGSPWTYVWTDRA